MYNKSSLFLGFVMIFLSFGFTTSLTNSSNDLILENIELVNVGEILCISNAGYNRETFILWYTGLNGESEAVSKMSVAGGQTSCFEIGRYESAKDWEVTRQGDNEYVGKTSFYGGSFSGKWTAKFY